MKSALLSLTEACRRIAIGYSLGRDLWLRGQLRGHRDASGRYWVSEESVSAEIAKRRRAARSPKASRKLATVAA